MIHTTTPDTTQTVDTDEAAPLLDFDTIVAGVHAAGFPAVVEHSGGNCATIYAGEVDIDADGDDRYPVLAGPGYFSGPGRTCGKGYPEEFSVGPQDEDLAEAVFVTSEQAAVDAILALLNLAGGTS